MTGTPQNIALIGFMGSGKSSVGRLLASRMGFRFVDTDALIVRQANLPITEIFARHGEAHFREEERLALESLRAETRRVIATGGGIVTNENNAALLRGIAWVVWLRADEETIFERVSRTDKRPLLRTENPRETIRALLAERQPLYEKAAHFAVDTSARPHDEIVSAIISEARAIFPCEP